MLCLCLYTCNLSFPAVFIRIVGKKQHGKGRGVQDVSMGARGFSCRGAKVLLLKTLVVFCPFPPFPCCDSPGGFPVPGAAEGAVSHAGVALWEPRAPLAAAAPRCPRRRLFPAQHLRQISALCLHTLPCSCFTQGTSGETPETSDFGAFPVAVTVLGPPG